jgi:UDP-N-acetylmuramoyl-tripeptide--D-alanyl-D-alanine ligase
MKLSLAACSSWLGLPPAAGAEVSSVSTDTRAIGRGALFVALRGERHDGHDHVAQAFEKGAVAAMVSRRVEAPGPLLEVADTLEGLQTLAREARTAWGRSGPNRTVVGVTGSAGKTTTKDAIAAVLATKMATGKTSGNFNNHIGLPLSLLNLPEDAEAAVIEIGMNHAGEIRRLAAIARPQIGVVTNAGTAHIENLGSRERVALAKRELIEALPADGVAVLNADDPRVKAFAGVHPGRSITYGFSEAAHVRATRAEFLPEGTHFAVADVGSFFCPLPSLGGLMAALAALAVARAFGMDLASVKEAVAALEAAPMRLHRLEARGATIWDDCYNSNPEAAMMMLDMLAATPAARRIAVLGEMRELGAWSEQLHREVGRHAAVRQVDLLVAIAGNARLLAEEAAKAGLDAAHIEYFDEPREAGLALRSLVRPGDAVLFKGSRGTSVDLALKEFLA